MRSTNSFAAAVHRLRRERGLSMTKVAEQTSFSVSYVSKLMHGHRPLLPEVVRELDAALAAGGELRRIADAQRVEGVDAVRPVQLPAAVADFTGREAVLRDLDGALAALRRREAPLTVVVEGSFWVGKTALVVHWATRVQSEFPGGCLFADLRGFALGRAVEPAAVLDGFLRALGAGETELTGTIEERSARYRSRLAERPALVILDNAADYEQVCPLLPGAGSAVVITSRDHQTALLARSGGLHVELPPLTGNEALQLLRRRVGDARVDVDLPAAETIVRRAGNLPMAILIAAEHALHHGDSLRNVAVQLRTERDRLDLFSSVDPAVNIHVVIDFSYLALAPQPARVFRLLGASPARSMSVEATAALTGLTPAIARTALEALRGAHLVEPVSAGRVRMNDLLRAYAYQRCSAEEPVTELDRCQKRLLGWYAATVLAASSALAPSWAGSELAPVVPGDVQPLAFGDGGYAAAMAWLDIEVPTVLRVARVGATGDLSWQLPAMLLPYFYLTKNWKVWLSAASEGLAAARRIGSRIGTARGLLSLGWVRHAAGHTADAIVLLASALHLEEELDDGLLEAWTAFALASAHASLDQFADAHRLYEHAERLFAEAELDLGLTVTRAMLAGILHRLGHQDRAASVAYGALSLAQTVGSRPVLSLAQHQLGLLLLQHGAHRLALTQLDAALAARRLSQESWGEAETLIARAEALQALGQPHGARESYCEAANILERLHDARAFGIHGKVANLDASLHAPHGHEVAS
ncbi:helix-turn-helix transcriptional regulator [Amycolatopsis sp. PS_44_ISF1]|uniref:helix-turn-helix transcriptional regulator n=1 Tax=Amycolatopsis sp. PS_44_ISF1 TaxID=2974917 RepID=UPI0028DECB28|nr:helix-turn-helix transcriptional regulator [Amycolatopsis sp. PS_44_ISF1]MDT8916025.1 helix-turn-helix domain-containing protein [Amycolatopsis sp. PS_44_ISF1]